MIPLTAMSAVRRGNPWVASVYAGIITAIIAYVATLLLQADQLIPFVVLLLLAGAGPVLGYALASGRVLGSIGGIIGGTIGAIPVVSIILWPILVGVLMWWSQSIGKLFLANLIGIIVSLALFFALATNIGQDPAWFTLGFVVLMAVWGAICGAAMTAWAKY